MMRPIILLCSLLLFPLPALAIDYLNQPAGSTTIADMDLSQLPRTGGQPDRIGIASVRYPGCYKATDATAPDSPPSVMDYSWTHNRGYGDSCILGFTLPPGTRSVYGYIRWKPSAKFHGWSIPNNKIWLIDYTRNHMYISMWRVGPSHYDYMPWGYQPQKPSGSNCHIATGVSCDLFGANKSSTRVPLGVYNTYEYFYQASTCPTCENGIVKIWLNGTLAVSYTTLNTPYPDLKITELHPVWDGYETSCSTCVDHHYFDHVRVAVGGTPGEGGVVTPPPPPSLHISSLQADAEGASMTISGHAANLRYWDDETAPSRPEVPNFTAGMLTYRLNKAWKPGTTFTCLQPQDDAGKWIDNYQCTRVIPGAIIVKPPPIELPPPPPVTMLQALQAVAARCLQLNSGCMTVGKVLDAELKKITP